MFRFTVDVPKGFRRDDEATRVLRDFEIVLRQAGASTVRKATHWESASTPALVWPCISA